MSALFPVYAIWQSHQGESSAKEVTALTDEEYILIFRQQGHPQVRLIDREEWSILQSTEVEKKLDAVVQSALIEGVDIEHKFASDD